MRPVWLPIYFVLTWLALPFAICYHWYRSISRGRKSAFAERFGFVPSSVKNRLAGQRVIWVHAVSVGEAIAARPMLKGLRQRYPDHCLLLSVTTETGRGVAEKDNLADLVIYFPFDTGFAVRRLMNLAAPRMIIIMETEIWPVFILMASRRRIPVFLANGRISARSFPRYQRFTWFFRPILAHFTRFGMQSQQDLERIIAIGAPPERCQVTGNLKYDIPYGAVTEQEQQGLRHSYRIPPGLLIFSAGSTHPGEEELILPVYQQLLQQFPDLLLVLVPRHPERSAELMLMLETLGLQAVRRSRLDQVDSDLSAGTVLLVDTVGELMGLYALSDLTFVGGSLVPTGGHNLLEPASRGIAMIFGPNMENFQEITALTLECGAGVQVQDQQGLLQAASEFLSTPELRQVIGSNGLKLLRDSGGATNQNLDLFAKAMQP